MLTNAIIESDGFIMYSIEADKRPLAFPSIVALTHTLTGYRVWNSIYINYFLYFCIVLTSTLYSIKWLGLFKGFILQLALSSIPVLIHCSTSGGYDTLNLLLIILTYLATFTFLRNPSAASFLFIILTSTLLIQVRPESVLYILIPLLSLIIKYKFIFTGKIKYIISVLLIFSIPIFYQFTSERKYFNEGNPTDNSGFINVKYLYPNIIDAITYLFHYKGQYNNSLILPISFICFILLTTYLIFYYKKNKSYKEIFAFTKNPIFISLIIISVGLISTLCVYMLLYWGSWKDPLVSRFSLPLQYIGISVFLGFLLYISNKTFSKIIGLFVVLITLTYTIPTTSKNHWNKFMYTFHQEKWLESLINETKSQKILYIAPSAQLPILMRQSGVSTFFANQNKDMIKGFIDSKKFDRILVLESILRTTIDNKHVELHGRLDPEFVLRHIDDFKFNSNADSRISELIDVRLD